MRRTLLALASLLLAAAGVAPEDRTRIEALITAQMKAFARNDADAAFAFASPELREQFGSASHFMAMVQYGYQPVYRPRAVTFGPLLNIDGRTVQEVAVIGPDGTPRLALYTMEQQPDGSWRIAGCMLTDKPNPGS